MAVNVGWAGALVSRRLWRLDGSAARPGGRVDAQCGEHQDRHFFSSSRCSSDWYIHGASGTYKARGAPDTSPVEAEDRSSIITGNPQTACRVAAGIAPSHHSND
jgi:hypothetical protein